MTTRQCGVLLALVSAGVFSTAGLFTKGVTADAWGVVFWRGLFAAALTLAYIAQRGSLREDLPGMGGMGVVVAVVSAAGTAAFLHAFKLTTIANVTLVYASAPFIAGLLSWCWTGERPDRRTLVASIVALLGVGVIVSGSLGAVHLVGDLLALAMTVAMAAVLAMYRHAPQTPAAGPMMLSSVLLLPPALLIGDPLATATPEIAVLAAFGLVFTVASITLVEAARRLPAAHTALLSALETPLAPLWAWMLLREDPALTTVVGGAMILIAVMSSQTGARD